MQEPIIPDPSKALGQNMLQHQPKEVLAFERAISTLSGVAVDKPEGYFATFIGNDVAFTDHTTV